MTNDTPDILNTVSQTLFDKKGFNILVLDVLGISTMTDYFVIVEGTSDRHVRALGQTVMNTLSSQGLKPLHTEGDKVGDWLVMDYGEFVVHIFMPGLREKYSLETLWRDGKIVDVKIDIATKTTRDAGFE